MCRWTVHQLNHAVARAEFTADGTGSRPASCSSTSPEECPERDSSPPDESPVGLRRRGDQCRGSPRPVWAVLLDGQEQLGPCTPQVQTPGGFWRTTTLRPLMPRSEAGGGCGDRVWVEAPGPCPARRRRGPLGGRRDPGDRRQQRPPGPLHHLLPTAAPSRPPATSPLTPVSLPRPGARAPRSEANSPPGGETSSSNEPSFSPHSPPWPTRHPGIEAEDRQDIGNRPDPQIRALSVSPTQQHDLRPRHRKHRLAFGVLTLPAPFRDKIEDRLPVLHRGTRDTHVRQRPHQVRIEEALHVIPQQINHTSMLPGPRVERSPVPLAERHRGAPPHTLHRAERVAAGSGSSLGLLWDFRPHQRGSARNSRKTISAGQRPATVHRSRSRRPLVSSGTSERRRPGLGPA